MITSYIKLIKGQKDFGKHWRTTPMMIAPNYIHYLVERTTLLPLKEYSKDYKKRGTNINSIPVFDYFH